MSNTVFVNLKKVKPLIMFGCSNKHSFETERQFPVILLIAKFWQFSSLRHKVEQVNVSLEKKKKMLFSKHRFFFQLLMGCHYLFITKDCFEMNVPL